MSDPIRDAVREAAAKRLNRDPEIEAMTKVMVADIRREAKVATQDTWLKTMELWTAHQADMRDRGVSVSDKEWISASKAFEAAIQDWANFGRSI